MTVSLLGPDQWDRFHKAAVLSALERVLEEGKRTGHPYAVHAELEQGYHCLVSGSVPSVIVDGKYLIVYEVGETFFTSKRTLFEVLIAKLGNWPGRLRSIPEALDALARQHGCTAIVGGNSVGRAGLDRMYTGAGFRPISQQFYKEVH